MTVWVVTGSRPPKRGYTLAEYELGYTICRAFWHMGDSLVTGGAIGWDAAAMKWAHDLGMYVCTLLPEDRRRTDEQAVKSYSDETIETGVGFWARDRLEIERGDKTLAFPLHEQNRSSGLSGTWHTWRTAESAHKQCALWVVRPVHPPLVAGPEGAVILDLIVSQPALL